MLSCKFCETFKETFFIEHYRCLLVRCSRIFMYGKNGLLKVFKNKKLLVNLTFQKNYPFNLIRNKQVSLDTNLNYSDFKRGLLRHIVGERKATCS